MPTYVCTTSAGYLTQDQRADIARLITVVHGEETGGPRYLVQVLFQELAEGSHYIAGEIAPLSQMWIRGDIRSGRTVEQKASILTRLLKGVSQLIHVNESEVWVYLSDIPAHNIAEFGRILPEPGEEDAWLDTLPSELKKRLITLATQKK